MHLIYGMVCYAFFFVTFLYTIAFVENFPVPQTIDVGPRTPMTEALVINMLLMALFAIQHSVMARPQFKAWWTQFVPKPVERSTYVLFATPSAGAVVLAVAADPGRALACQRPPRRGCR